MKVASEGGLGYPHDNNVERLVSDKPYVSNSSMNNNYDYDDDLVNGMRETPYKSVPCKFLYDEAGSLLFEKITDLEEYYPYRAESEILEIQGDSIIDAIPKNAVLVELGAGDCSKTVILLSKMVARHGPEQVRFIAVDVSREALRQAKESLKKRCGCIPEENITMIEDEYLNGLVKAQEYVGNDPLCVLWLGSSVGNFTREQAVDFFISMRHVLNDDAMVLLGTDLWKDEKVLMNAYNDSLGVTRDFIVNGMMHVLRACNHSMQEEAPEDLWTYEPHINHELTQVEMWVRAKQDMHDVVPGIHVMKGERLLVEISRKFTLDDVSALACLSNFVVHSTWKSSQFSLQLLGSVRHAFERCWNDSDALFHHVPDWTCKPIALRHPFVFYYGHVASFTKMKLNQDNSSQTSSMDIMLSRGIDPHVDDPELCHNHPEVPASWPSKQEMLGYVKDARNTILNLLDENQDMKIVGLCLEHERMHQETLCYMLAQMRKACYDDTSTMLQSGLYFNNAAYTDSIRMVSYDDMMHIPKTVVRLGVDKSKIHDFRWDNEYGQYDPHVVRNFHVATMPVTVKEFANFIASGGYQNAALWSEEDFQFNKNNMVNLPATWSAHKDTFLIHMPEKSYLLEQVANAPVYVSLVEALAFATWKRARIMTEQEYEAALIEFRAQGNESLAQGGWEWTTSVFSPLKGFTPMATYPEYSTDFFDGLHFTLKGSSPYTHPAMRRDSFRNFYQKNYRYVFAKFRIVCD